MKIEFDLEKVSTLHDVMDAIVATRLKEERDMILSWDGWVHPDDVKRNKKLIKAIKVLLDYYEG